ncbi:hypothetical protein [Bordetella petrii]|uniref:hypothetical protein n=1 Tax=Bordetella petrii TaxID=94624 RepID=UPI00030086CE|nr:hypothetical protein [Bordetella petrii]
MSTSNWPNGLNMGSSNWTGRAQRTSDWGGNWAPDSHRIPRSAWIGAAAVAALLFFIVPLIGHAAGF